MFRGELLIDGYNVLHAAGLSRRSYGPGEFERTRRRLLKLLSGQLFTRERERTRVVFDAPGTGLGPSPPRVVHGICVLFAGGDGDADAAIERLIRQSSAPRRLHVVSSDHRLQKAARRRRAHFYDSDVFLAQIARRPTPQERARDAEPVEKQQGLSAPGEVDAWLKAFGSIETSDDSSDHRPPPQASLPEPSQAPSPSRSSCGGKRRAQPGENLKNSTEVAFWEARIAELWQQTLDTEDSASSDHGRMGG